MSDLSDRPARIRIADALRGSGGQKIGHLGIADIDGNKENRIKLRLTPFHMAYFRGDVDLPGQDMPDEPVVSTAEPQADTVLIGMALPAIA